MTTGDTSPTLWLLVVAILSLCIIGAAMGINSSLEVYNNKIEKKLDKLEQSETNVYINTSEKDVNYMFGVATAYCPSAGGINSDSDPTVTATMKPAKNGVIAVNPKQIPYGSEVMIIHGNTVIRGQAQDTGGAMRQNPKQVDILMEDLQDAKNWGRREVHILWW